MQAPGMTHHEGYTLSAISMNAFCNAGTTAQGCVYIPQVAQYRQNHLTVPVLPAKKFRAEQTEILRCKRRVDMAKLGYRPHPTAVARRNERERNRVKHINTTFATLRNHLPTGGKNKKMSKVDTLKSAIKYIKHLQQILDSQEQDSQNILGSRTGSISTVSSDMLNHSLSSMGSGSPPVSPSSSSSSAGSPSHSYSSEAGYDAYGAAEEDADLMDLSDWF